MRDRWLPIIAGICFLAYVTPAGRRFWAIPLFFAIAAVVWFLTRRAGIRFGGSEYLCDTCKYSYGDVCSRPEKPNATRCPDYKR